MLEALIAQLVLGKVTTVGELAGHLSVSSDLLEQMLLSLESGGYITQLSGQCQTACSSCPQAGPCALIQGGRIWSVTDKGRRLAARFGHAPST
ncbi:MAG: FeoC-like transcriptional regulator [Anaerolineae bacterium]